MASLTLKNVSDDLLRSLREAAETDRRSLSQEIIFLLSIALRNVRKELAPITPETKAQLAAWRKLAGKWKSDVDFAAETGQLLRRRSPGREVDF